MKNTNPVKLINMEDVVAEEVKWLWHPYIPYGKVTIIQGDPGEGKTTLALQIIALLTKGLPMPKCDIAASPVNVIYQTAEDGLADTVKPRLLSAGADCSRVLVIDESEKNLTFVDERLEQAIKDTGAKLAVLDPLQAYLGAGVDMHRANELRPIFTKLAQTAERTGCAIVLIGHMNKAHGAKSSYRGLGSIDIGAAARSILCVGRLKDKPTVRVIAHAKSSLAPEGCSIAFELSEDDGFSWLGYCDVSLEQLLSGYEVISSKTEQMEKILLEMLKEKPKRTDEVYAKANEQGISERTVKTAKKNLGVVSEKISGRWFWRLP